MNVLYKISSRNLLRHKGKSIVIAFIIFFGALVMTIGNSVSNGMSVGLSKNIEHRILGNALIVSTNQKEDNILFGTPKTINPISDYNKVKSILDSQDYIAEYLPFSQGFLMVFNKEGDPGFLMVFGVNFKDYQNYFLSNTFIVEGQLLKPGERGLLMNIKARNHLYAMTGMWVLPRNYPLVESNLSPRALLNIDNIRLESNLIVMGSSFERSTLDIPIDVKGVFKFNSLNELFGMMNLIDIESFRESFGYITTADLNVKLTEEEEKLLGMEENLETLFEEGELFTEVGNVIENSYVSVKTKFDTAESFNTNLDSGTYNMISLKFKDSIDSKQALKELNNVFREQNVDARAISWEKASGQIGMFANIFRGVIFGFVIFLFFVAMIVIMNTLSMSAIERVSEIAMMRAVGAQRGFIGRMFILETAILSFLSGGLGILVGAIIVKIIAALNISSTNDFVLLIFGGDTFNPILDLKTFLIGVLQLTVVTLLAVLYPIRVARRISPLDAIERK